MTERTFTSYSFQQFLNEHKLMASRCQECGGVFLPPRPLCPSCYSEAMEWAELSGEGRLAAFTAVHIGSSTMIAAGYDRSKPYLAGVVQLPEGPAISAQIIGFDAVRPEQVNIGAPLRVAFIDRGTDEERRAYLAFEASNGR
jgi:uncharacterized protein